MIHMGYPGDPILVAIGKIAIRHGQLDYSLKMTVRTLAGISIIEAVDATERPDHRAQRAYQRDPAAIETWQREQFPAIARQAKASGGEVYFWDESGFRADAVHGKTWGRKGQTPVVERPGQRQSISAASAVNARGAFWYCTYQGGLNAELFVALLRKMMRRRSKPVHLVIDGLPAHKTALVKAYVASTDGMLTLHFLPGYAPELNPDELVWSHMKRTGVARAPLRRASMISSVIRAISPATSSSSRTAGIGRNSDPTERITGSPSSSCAHSACRSSFRLSVARRARVSSASRWTSVWLSPNRLRASLRTRSLSALEPRRRATGQDRGAARCDQAHATIGPVILPSTNCRLYYRLVSKGEPLIDRERLSVGLPLR
jgi:transposase